MIAIHTSGSNVLYQKKNFMLRNQPYVRAYKSLYVWTYGWLRNIKVFFWSYYMIDSIYLKRVDDVFHYSKWYFRSFYEKWANRKLH